MDAPLRIALIGTPRSGNTWLRLLLGDAVGVPTIAVHELTERELAELPAECVVQIHWRRQPAFVELLETHGFRVLTLARHPCDVLVSILQFAVHETATSQWLRGRGGDESCLFGASPRSRAFVEYAGGERARELLAVTTDWWEHPGAVTARYEELVRDPVGELARLVSEFRPDSKADLPAIVAKHGIAELRKTAMNSHFWKGTPGHWREFFTAEIAGEIFEANADHFARLGYACDPDPALTDSQADRNWVAATGPSLREALNRASAGHVRECESIQAEREALRAERDALRIERDGYALQLQLARTQVAEERARIAQFHGLQGFSIRVARAVQAVRNLWAVPRSPSRRQTIN